MRICSRSHTLQLSASEGGGESLEFDGKALVIHVDANAYDCVAQHRRCIQLRGDGGGLDQDAAALFVVDQKIVGPANIGLEAGGAGDCCLYGEARCEGEPQSVDERDLRAQEDAEIEAIAWGGVPFVVAAASACSLLVGYPDTAMGCSGLRGFEGESIGRGCCGR